MICGQDAMDDIHALFLANLEANAAHQKPDVRCWNSLAVVGWPNDGIAMAKDAMLAPGMVREQTLPQNEGSFVTQVSKYPKNPERTSRASASAKLIYPSGKNWFP